MVDKICDKLMTRVKAKMPEVDQERAEIIRYGFELLIGEIPKVFLIFILAILLGKIRYFIISVIIIASYRTFSGGVHLRTHIGCIIATTSLYLGNVYISELLEFPNIYIKLILAILIYIFAVTMIILYAPADTDTVPILIRKERKQKRNISIIIATVSIILSFIVKDNTISNMLLLGIFFQTLTITKFTYDIFKAKFGYLEYIKSL